MRLLLIALLLVSACGGIDGEGLFAQPTIGGRAGCVVCHSITPGVIVIGPSLAGIGVTAGSRAGDAAAYVRTSIIDPDAHIADGYVAGEMPGGWTDLLSAEEIEALVDYLVGLP